MPQIRNIIQTNWKQLINIVRKHVSSYINAAGRRLENIQLYLLYRFPFNTQTQHCNIDAIKYKHSFKLEDS